MTGASPLNPLHLLALVSPLCRLQADEVRPWERLAGLPSPPPWKVALEHMSLLTQRRRGWVLMGLLRVRGLLTARRRTGGAWEVDCLQVAPGDVEAAGCLLGAACGQLGQQGVQRLFLRLEAESPLVRAACRAGFYPLRQERLYRLDGGHRLEEAPVERLLPLNRSHLSALFQLYNAAVPASVRCLEGMTLRDWQAAQEPWRHPQDVALWDGGRILAWARLVRVGGNALLSLTLHPEAQARARQVVASVLHMVPSQRPLFWVVAAYQPAVSSALQEAGLEPVAEYLVLMRHLLHRQAQKTAEPERVGGAVPVS